jgi:ABC-type bacteriocin/lantibiotic exporter with double-glycine peptidase domain
MSNIPTYMNNLFSANVTIARVVAVLCLPIAPCVTRSNTPPTASSSTSVSVDMIACTTPNRLFQRPVALQLQRGCNAVVSGRVGCGKSTLLQIIAGECNLSTTSCCVVAGRTLYVPQEPQLFKGSIKDNICLSNICDDAKLQHVLWASCLVEDVEALEHGLRTDVGSKGSSLSGGQRARVSIARVLYHVAEDDVLLLDDVFAALDEQTFKHVLNRMFSSSSIPESVTVIMTCARGLNCRQPFRPINITDGAVTMLSSSHFIFESSSPTSPQSPSQASHFSSASLPGSADMNLKVLLEELARHSKLPEHNTSSGGTGEVPTPNGAKLTRLVDWTNLAV